MNYKHPQNLLKTIKDERRGGAPREHWVNANRNILLTQVRNTTDVTNKPKLLDQVRHLFGIFIPAESAFVAVRTLGIFLLFTATVLGGGLASAQLYRDAMPGEMLYGVKVTLEKTQMILSPNDEYRIGLHTEFADRRVNEIAWLAESANINEKLIGETLIAFEKDVTALSNGLEELSQSSNESSVNTAKIIERKLTVYHNILKKAATTVPPEVKLAINSTRNKIDDTAISAMAIIVQSHMKGDERASRTVVVHKFEDRIKQAENSLDSVIADLEIYEEKSTAIRAKTAIAEAKILIEEENYQAALSKIVEVAELTKEAEAEAVEEDLLKEESEPENSESENQVSEPNTDTDTDTEPDQQSDDTEDADDDELDTEPIEPSVE